jgi:hypothetical protein
MAKVEIIGLDKIKAVFNSLPEDMRPYLLRDLARKPALRGSAAARNLQPIGDTGATAKTIGVLRVKNSKQPFVEVGYRGRSLGHIYTSGQTISRKNRGTVKGFPWLFEKAGDVIRTGAKAEMKGDITKTFVRAFKKRGVGK